MCTPHFPLYIHTGVTLKTLPEIRATVSFDSPDESRTKISTEPHSYTTNTTTALFIFDRLFHSIVAAMYLEPHLR